MNYPWKEAIISYIFKGNAQEFLHSIRSIINHYPKETLDSLMNILGTHDTPRILTVLGGIQCYNKDEMASKKAFLSEKDKEKAIEKLKMAAILQFTLPGVPCIYYGDENAMEGHIDPFCRRCFNWDNLNEKLIEFYKTLGFTREELRDVFKDGKFEVLEANEGLLIYVRENKNGKVFVFVNQSRYITRCGVYGSVNYMHNAVLNLVVAVDDGRAVVNHYVEALVYYLVADT
jgi:glycosidase